MDFKGKLFSYSGLKSINWRTRPNGLYCFNYHRIGDSNCAEFDPNVFSCTKDEFHLHLQFFKQHFTLISIEQLKTIIDSKQSINKRYALITFDDGYLDNYQLAFPILKAENVPAVFFIATDFIDQKVFPWWDETAWIIKHIDIDQQFVDFWQLPNEFLCANETEQIRQILLKLKIESDLSLQQKLIELNKFVKDSSVLEKRKRSLFMSWDMLREVEESGITIGSQTCSHQVLSHLTESQQKTEILNSKQRLEQELQSPICCFAYPVGSEDSFNDITLDLLKSSDYTMAFTFVSGVNTKVSSSKYTLSRYSIDGNCDKRKIQTQVAKNIFLERLKSLSPFTK
ncbi:polysaccharide deacetylase family protein [Thalassotalea crassostreae]|uniref:polysaccharide deacetylase family protein n=1 Tax=Thalassotalea crassostreae TaxID=1763536 RepID=UPI0008394EFE|nr:polysaccharide deacetylase family protein [Thalassotalea crassostreae]